MGYVYDGTSYPTRSLMCEARRFHYFQLIDSGMNSTQAARVVGVSKRTGKVWRNGRTRATGRNESEVVSQYRETMQRPKERDQRYLCPEERIQIADGIRVGETQRAIARRLKREPSTISREIKTNLNPETGRYDPYRAQELSEGRFKRPKVAKIIAHPKLLAEVRQGLNNHWSPEQIAGELRRRFPNNWGMNLSTETIYQAVYVQAKGELKLDVKRALRSGRAKRRPQTPEQNRKPRFREPMVMISERPPEVEDRAIPGHWEGDLITGAQNKSAIGTLVERTTGWTLLLYLPDDHTAEAVQAAIIKKMKRLPKLLRNSLTWDQGSELALHKEIRAALDMDVYFCDPHSPWQRGTNENTNGLLRQYFPKGTDLSVHSEDYLDAVAEELNDRPRKRFEFKKPSELILDILELTA